LSDAEEEVEMAGLAYVRSRAGVVIEDRIDGRVEVVAEVYADGADRRSVAKTDSDCVGIEVEVAGSDCGIRRLARRDGYISAGALVRLVEVLDALKHVAGVLKGVTHVVEDDKGDAVSNEWKCRRRETQFEAVYYYAGTANGVAGGEIARAGIVGAEAAV
jgi:hypothetical protein